MDNTRDINGMVVLDGYVLTSYEKIRNCYVKDCYKCDDIEGVMKEEKKSTIDICGPISLISIRYDSFKDVYYYEFEFIDKKDKKRIITFKSSEIGSDKMIKTLRDQGLDIINKASFDNFIGTMIKANNTIKNNTIKEGYKTNWLEIQVGSTIYGFPRTEEGYNFEHYVFKDEIINKKAEFDGPLFQTKGSLEKQIEIINKIGQDFKEEKILKLALAFALCGNLLPFLKIDTPFMLITAPSGAGKQLLSDLMAGLYGKNHGTNTGLQRHSGDSLASRSAYRTHFGPLPTLYDELQDLINKNKKLAISPAETVKDLSYEITTGGNGSRSNQDGTQRDDCNDAYSPAAGFCEGQQFKGLTDGGSNRITFLDSELPDKKHYVKSENPFQYMKESTENYGFIAPEFIKYIMDQTLMEEFYIQDGFTEYKEKAAEYFDDKIASSCALLVYTYNLMVESKVFPLRWKKADLDEYFTYLRRFNYSVSSTEEVFESWIGTVMNHAGFPFINKHITQNEFNELSKNPNTRVYGRKEIKDGKLYVYITEEELRSQLQHTAEKTGLTGFCFDLRRLYGAGYLLKSTDPDRPFKFRRTNIQREFDKKNRTGYETVVICCVDAPEFDGEIIDNDIMTPDLELKIETEKHIEKIVAEVDDTLKQQADNADTFKNEDLEHLIDEYYMLGQYSDVINFDGDDFEAFKEDLEFTFGTGIEGMRNTEFDIFDHIPVTQQIYEIVIKKGYYTKHKLEEA